MVYIYIYTIFPYFIYKIHINEYATVSFWINSIFQAIDPFRKFFFFYKNTMRV